MLNIYFDLLKSFESKAKSFLEFAKLAGKHGFYPSDFLRYSFKL